MSRIHYCMANDLQRQVLHETNAKELTNFLFERPGVRHSQHILEHMIYCTWRHFNSSQPCKRGLLLLADARQFISTLIFLLTVLGRS